MRRCWVTRIHSTAAGVVTSTPRNTTESSPEEPMTPSTCRASSRVDAPAASDSKSLSSRSVGSAAQPAAATVTATTAASTVPRWRARDRSAGTDSATAEPTRSEPAGTATPAGPAGPAGRSAPRPAETSTPIDSVRPRSRTNGSGEMSNVAKLAEVAAATVSTTRRRALRVK